MELTKDIEYKLTDVLEILETLKEQIEEMPDEIDLEDDCGFYIGKAITILQSIPFTRRC